MPATLFAARRIAIPEVSVIPPATLTAGMSLTQYGHSWRSAAVASLSAVGLNPLRGFEPV